MLKNGGETWPSFVDKRGYKWVIYYTIIISLLIFMFYRVGPKVLHSSFVQILRYCVTLGRYVSRVWSVCILYYTHIYPFREWLMRHKNYTRVITLYVVSSMYGPFNSSPSGQNIHTNDFFRCIFVNENFVFWLKCHWRLFLRVQLTITQHWFR